MTPSTTRAQSVTGVALKVVGALLALYFVHDAWLYREAEQSRTVSLKREMDDKQRVAASHDAYAVRLEEEKDILYSLVKRLPSTIDSPAIEKKLHDQATLAGIEIVAMHMGVKRIREGFYGDLPVDLVAQGSTVQFVKFMDSVFRESPLRQVSAMQIEPTADKGTLKAAMTVNYYRYVEDGE
jgi:Tfp pilus assembly protein PilO